MIRQRPDLRIDYELGPEGLSVCTSATNAGTMPSPYGAGAHPYLSLGTGKIDSLHLSSPGDHPDRVHDRGRCPLYVRAQLDTVGLSWTQRDLVRLKATARETGKTQLTGYFRRWWQVLGSNQPTLSRRFYRPPIPTHRNGR